VRPAPLRSFRRRGWKEAVTPVAHNNITGKRYVDHWREAGFECDTPIKNTGAGAAMMACRGRQTHFPALLVQ
jgi:hypothetical protein